MLRHLVTFTRGASGAYVVDGSGWKWQSSGNGEDFIDYCTVQPVKPSAKASIIEMTKGRNSYVIIGSKQLNAAPNSTQPDIITIDGFVFEIVDSVRANNTPLAHYRSLACSLVPLDGRGPSW